MSNIATIHFSAKNVLVSVLVILLTACSLAKIEDQALYIDRAAEISGKVKIESNKKGPVITLLFREDNGSITLINQFTVTSDGAYKFYVTPDKYLVAAFIDSNKDGEYKLGEHATYFGIETGKPTVIAANISENITVKPLVIKHALKSKGNYKVDDQLNKITKSIGNIVSLKDPIFSDENASMGMWRPIDFINEVGGGLFLLDKYQENKIPILFVHGINGHSGTFSELIKNLDTKHFQPWVLYYPTGLRLDMVSDYMVKAINSLHSKYRFKEIYVIAHSMGGLVSRSFIKKNTSSKHPVKIKFYMTINSPQMGMDSAISGVKWSPIVIPVWRDMASNSEFIKDLHKWTLPKTIPYYLIFSFSPGEEGDGVVPMKSQLTAKLQAEAFDVYGFNATHTDLLKEKRFIKHFNKVMENTLK